MKMFEKINLYKKKFENKKGFVAIETVIALCAALMIILLFLGFWLYLYPRIVLEKEIHTLAQQAKITGGLTSQQVEDYSKRMTELGYTIQSLSVGTTSNPAPEVAKYNGLVNVYPKGGVHGTCTSPAYQSYVRRTDSEKIIISVRVRANGFIKGPLAFFGTITQLDDSYNLTETVMSERNKC